MGLHRGRMQGQEQLFQCVWVCLMDTGAFFFFLMQIDSSRGVMGYYCF